MGVWWGSYKKLVYSVPKEVEWYGCTVGRYRELVYGVPKGVEWYSVW